MGKSSQHKGQSQGRSSLIERLIQLLGAVVVAAVRTRGQQKGKGKRKGKDKSQERSPLGERLIALVGALAVLAVVGFMFYQAIWGEESPPNLEIEVMAVRPVGGEYLVEILAINRGGNTAAGATLTGKLMPEQNSGEQKEGKAGDGQGSGRQTEPQPLETAQVTIDYVPPHSEVQAGLYFSQKPTPERLKFSVGGYHRP